MSSTCFTCEDLEEEGTDTPKAENDCGQVLTALVLCILSLAYIAIDTEEPSALPSRVDVPLFSATELSPLSWEARPGMFFVCESRRAAQSSAEE